MTAASERILYGERRADGTTLFWRMTTLWAAADGKPHTFVAIADLGILDGVVWFGGPKDVQPTIRRVAERARDIFNADLSYPIIMTKSGEVLDGAHRIARAYIEGVERLPAVVLDAWPAPDGVVRAGGGEPA